MRRLMEAAVAEAAAVFALRATSGQDARLRSGINSCFIVQKQLVQLNSFMTQRLFRQREPSFNSLKSESIC